MDTSAQQINNNAVKELTPTSQVNTDIVMEKVDGLCDSGSNDIEEDSPSLVQGTSEESRDLPQNSMEIDTKSVTSNDNQDEGLKTESRSRPRLILTIKLPKPNANGDTTAQSANPVVFIKELSSTPDESRCLAGKDGSNNTLKNNENLQKPSAEGSKTVQQVAGAVESGKPMNGVGKVPCLRDSSNIFGQANTLASATFDPSANSTKQELPKGGNTNFSAPLPAPPKQAAFQTSKSF